MAPGALPDGNGPHPARLIARRVRFQLIAWLSMLTLAAGASAQAGPGLPDPATVADAVVGVTEMAEFAVAGDGRTIGYVTATPTDEGDAYAVAISIGDARDPGSIRGRAVLPPSPTAWVRTGLSFSPLGTDAAYLSRNELHLIEAATGRGRTLAIQGLPAQSAITAFAWSPDGTELALIIASAPPPEPPGGREMTVAWPYWGGDSGPGRRVAIVQVASGRAELLTGADLDVAAMSWSPDGRRLALAASPTASASRFYDQDIYVVDRRTRATTGIVRLDGVDSEPSWSPDGRWIAFASQQGEGSRGWLQQLALYDTRTGAISYPARAQFEAGLGTPHDVAWASDGRLYFVSDHRLHRPIFELELEPERLRRFSSLDLSVVSGLTVARSGDRLIFGCESIDRPRELCVSPMGRFEPRRLTSLNPSLSLPPSDVEVLSWPSRDGRWQLEGILIRPRGGRSPRPLITLIEGGPSMVRPHFGLVQQYPVHELLAGGYAVFVPNTRGRGGYSKAFRNAIPDERDFVGGAFGDLMAGIDRLVSTGVADPDRLGIAGFSYGGVLTAYAITQTDRFKAASINDSPANLVYTMSLGAANPVMQEHWRHQAGFADPYHPADLARMRAQSPISHVANVATPSLLEYGYREHGGVGELGGAEFFQGLRRFAVPAELILYPRTGHGIYEPRLRRESARRNREWFDHWLLGRTTERMRRNHGPRP